MTRYFRWFLFPLGYWQDRPIPDCYEHTDQPNLNEQ